MKPAVIQVIAVLLMLTACDGKETPVSGTITLTNELYDAGDHYYALGLSLAGAKAVPYFQGEDKADIWLMAGPVTDGGPVVAYLAANTLDPPFALYGSYNTESAARDAFEGLRSISSVSYIDLAAPLEENQVWVLRTRDYKYAKFRIITLVLDTSGDAPWASCKLEWAYQPDGTATFP